MVSGRLIGVDVDKTRVGIAQAYLDIILTLPVETLKVWADGSELRKFASFIREETTTAVFVELPRLFNGKEDETVCMARSCARHLVRKISPVPVWLTDERLSSVMAHERLRVTGVSIREHEKMVDQVAAQQILEQTIEMPNTGANLIGELVTIDW